jgi:hypothetical protein
VIFAYHHASRSLVLPRPDAVGHFAVTTAALRAMGWKADDEDLRKSLPRADTPTVARPTAAEVAAVQRH